MRSGDLTPEIIGAAIKVHRKLGPGLLESAYQACLAYEVQQLGYTGRAADQLSCRSTQGWHPTHGQSLSGAGRKPLTAKDPKKAAKIAKKNSF